MAEARGGRDGRQEGCERGYYHLHRNLNHLLLHSTLIFVLERNYGKLWEILFSRSQFV